MADLSKKEWEGYDQQGHKLVYKNISTVQRKGARPDEVAEFYSNWAENNNEYDKVSLSLFFSLSLSHRYFFYRCVL